MSGQATVFIQWKGTEACFDLTCECGNRAHFDTDFAYYVRCPACERVWQMPTTQGVEPADDDVAPTPVTAAPHPAESILRKLRAAHIVHVDPDRPLRVSDGEGYMDAELTQEEADYLAMEARTLEER